MAVKVSPQVLNNISTEKNHTVVLPIPKILLEGRYNRQIQWGTRTPGYLDTWIPGYQDTWIPGHLDTWTPGYLDTRSPGNLDTRTPGYQDTRTPGYQDTWILGYLDARIPEPVSGSWCRYFRYQDICDRQWPYMQLGLGSQFYFHIAWITPSKYNLVLTAFFRNEI